MGIKNKNIWNPLKEILTKQNTLNQLTYIYYLLTVTDDKLDKDTLHKDGLFSEYDEIFQEWQAYGVIERVPEMYSC